MKKILLTFWIISFITGRSFAQWESESTGFSVKRGIFQIVSPSANVVWATAHNASIIYSPCRDYCKSTDGGNTWTAATISNAPSNSVWSCLSAIDENNAWALFWKNPAPGGTLWRTSDGGATWTQQGAGIIFQGDYSFPDVVHFWDVDTGVVIGDPNNGEFEIYNTTDGGTTWIPDDGANISDPLLNEYGLYSVFAVYKNMIWFGTTGSRLYRSTDKGLTWNTYTVAGDTDWISMIAFEDENKGWVQLSGPSGYFHDVKRTLDGGTTWTSINTSENFFKNFFCYVPNTTDILVSTGNHTDNTDVYGSSYSPDGGDTWVLIDDSVFHSAVDFFDETNGWSGDVNVNETTGGMWKYDGNIATAVAEASSNNSFKLYPNPGDGLFYFSFNAENNKPIHLKITNAVGKIVVDKIYRDISQTWLRSIDLRRCNRGVYILNLENNGEQIIKQLVIQ